MKFRVLLALALLWAPPVLAQSSPGWTYGQVPTPGQWNAAFASKQDVLGYTPVNRAGDTMSGPLRTFAPTGTSAGLVIVPGLVPTLPANGSLWTTTGGLYARINGATVGPLGPGTIGGPGTTTVGNIATWGNTSGTSLLDGGLALPSSAIVGISDTQTLTNKSISASQVNSGTLAAARMPALTGDVTSTVGTVATTISAGAVTSAKMAAGAAVGNIGYTPLNVASNLSDVANAATAWTNLGGGSIGKLSSVSLTANVSGTLPVGNGGTGTTTLTSNGILIGNGTSAVSAAAAMMNGQILVGQTSAAPLPKTMSGDCTLAAAGGITCLSTNGTAFTTFAPLASPALTGTPTVPTATVGTNTTQAASTAFVTTAVANGTGISVPIRQTVQSGPASGGLPNFLPGTSGTLSIASQNVSTGVNTLVVAAANGFGANGAINFIGISTSNLTWSSLTASTTNYLFVTVSAGALTAGSTARAPIYQCGGTPSTTNAQYTFDYCAMLMYVGHGSTTSIVNVVFVGEAVTSGTGVTSTVAYAYQGRYDSGFTGSLPAAGATLVYSHNLGVVPLVTNFLAQCNTAGDSTFAVGDIINLAAGANGSTGKPAPLLKSARNTATFVGQTTDATAWWATQSPAGGQSPSLTISRWTPRFFASRGW